MPVRRTPAEAAEAGSRWNGRRRHQARALPLLHERQRAESVEGDGGDEPLEGTEQDALIDELPDEAEDDARQSKDRPDHWITSPRDAQYPSLDCPNPIQTGEGPPGWRNTKLAANGARRCEKRHPRGEVKPRSTPQIDSCCRWRVSGCCED